MTQNQLITILTIILLIVIGGSMFVLFGSSGLSTPNPSEEAIEVDTVNRFNLQVLEQQSYQLLNKQLIREGALPVKPPITIGKANPFI